MTYNSQYSMLKEKKSGSLLKVHIENAARILAIELFNGFQKVSTNSIVTNSNNETKLNAFLYAMTM
jgi:hypothetical protein